MIPPERDGQTSPHSRKQRPDDTTTFSTSFGRCTTASSNARTYGGRKRSNNPPDEASQSGEAEAEADEPEAEPPIANPDTNINWTGVAAPPAINPNNDDGDDSDSDSDYDDDDDEECNEMFDLERDEDLARQILSEADRRLMAVYGGDSVHQNDGRTLHGGIKNDAATCML